MPPCSAASFCCALDSSMRSTARSAATSSASCCFRRFRRWYEDAWARSRNELSGA